MSSSELLHMFPAEQLGPIKGRDRVVVFGVLGDRRLGPTILVHAPTLRLSLDQLANDVQRVVFIEGSSLDPTTISTIAEMLEAMGSEDGLVRFETAAEAIKLISGNLSGEPAPIISRGIERSSVISFRPPEVLRRSSLVAAVSGSRSEPWVDPAGLVAANGGRIQTYPRPQGPG
jgi:hypothetical protein